MWINRPLAKVLFGLLWSKGCMLKGKGKIPNLSPFPLPLFPTYARNLMCRNLQEFSQNIFDIILHLIVDIETHPLNSL
jgi:hypothetical protein